MKEELYFQPGGIHSRRLGLVDRLRSPEQDLHP